MRLPPPRGPISSSLFDYMHEGPKAASGAHLWRLELVLESVLDVFPSLLETGLRLVFVTFDRSVYK